MVSVVDGRDSFLQPQGPRHLAGRARPLQTRHAFGDSVEAAYSEGPNVVTPSVTTRLWVDQSNPEPVIVFPDPDEPDTPESNNWSSMETTKPSLWDWPRVARCSHLHLADDGLGEAAGLLFSELHRRVPRWYAGALPVG